MSVRTLVFVVAMAASLFAPIGASRAQAQAQDTAQDAAQEKPKPTIDQFAGVFAAMCESRIVSQMGETARAQLGASVPPALVAEMEDVGRVGVCGCFIDRMRAAQGTPLAAPFDAGDINAFLDGLRPDYDRCMGDALKPKIENICKLVAGADGKAAAAECTCLGREAQALDSAELSRGAERIFQAFKGDADRTGEENPLQRIGARCRASK